MKIGFNTYEQRPQFKASFATTPGTKKALKALCEENHYRLYELTNVLKKAEAKDVIEVSLIKKSPARNFNRYIFKNTANNKSVNSDDRGFIDGASNLLFSNGEKVKDYEAAFLTYKEDDIEYINSHFEKELGKEANTTEDRKTASEMYDIAFNLEEQYHKHMEDGANLIKTAEEKEKAYLLKKLNLLD